MSENVIAQNVCFSLETIHNPRGRLFKILDSLLWTIVFSVFFQKIEVMF